MKAALAEGLRCLNRREYSIVELRLRLLKKDHAADVVEAVLEQLQGWGYLDDDRALGALVRSIAHGLHGPYHARDKARQRGFDADAIEAYLRQPEVEMLFDQALLRWLEKMKRIGKAVSDQSVLKRRAWARGFDASGFQRLRKDDSLDFQEGEWP